jgi:hypothetical protein
LRRPQLYNLAKDKVAQVVLDDFGRAILDYPGQPLFSRHEMN